jgi:hypothetical protein
MADSPIEMTENKAIELFEEHRNDRPVGVVSRSPRESRRLSVTYQGRCPHCRSHLILIGPGSAAQSRTECCGRPVIVYRTLQLETK